MSSGPEAEVFLNLVYTQFPPCMVQFQLVFMKAVTSCAHDDIWKSSLVHAPISTAEICPLSMSVNLSMILCTEDNEPPKNYN